MLLFLSCCQTETNHFKIQSDWFCSFFLLCSSFSRGGCEIRRWVTHKCTLLHFFNLSCVLSYFNFIIIWSVLTVSGGIIQPSGKLYLRLIKQTENIYMCIYVCVCVRIHIHRHIYLLQIINLMILSFDFSAGTVVGKYDFFLIFYTKQQRRIYWFIVLI